MSDSKIILLGTGNILKYRIGLVDYAYPNVAKEKVIFFTNKCSYDDLSDYYKNQYNFVFIEDYTKNYPISQKYEKFLCESDEAEHHRKLRNFYSPTTGNLYPYHISRFIFLYLIENNIKNFVIGDSDYIFLDDVNEINKSLDFLKEGEFHFPFFGPKNPFHYINFCKEHLSEKYQNINFEVEEFLTFDGFCKGFHFRSLEEMKLFFDLWNDTIEIILSNYNKFIGFTEITVGTFLNPEWITQYLSKVFESNFNYRLENTYSAFYSEELKINTATHISRPEQQLYYEGKESYGGYENFIYKDIDTVSDFIKQNRDALYAFYNNRAPNYFELKITDTHVLLKNKGIHGYR